MSITKYLLGLSIILGSTSVIAKDYACFIDPWDEKPENRINVLQSMGFFMVLHSESDRKTLASKAPPIQKIRDVKYEFDRTVYLVPNGGFVVTNETDRDGRFLALFAKSEHNDPSTYTKGIPYRCEVRTVTRD